MAELVDALVLGTSVERRGGSSPFSRTKKEVNMRLQLPTLRGDPCSILVGGPYNLEKRNEIRAAAKSDNPNRKFRRIYRNYTGIHTFDFNTE